MKEIGTYYAVASDGERATKLKWIGVSLNLISAMLFLVVVFLSGCSGTGLNAPGATGEELGTPESPVELNVLAAASL